MSYHIYTLDQLSKIINRMIDDNDEESRIVPSALIWQVGNFEANKALRLILKRIESGRMLVWEVEAILDKINLPWRITANRMHYLE